MRMHAHGVVHTCTRGDGVEVTDRRAFHACEKAMSHNKSSKDVTYDNRFQRGYRHLSASLLSFYETKKRKVVVGNTRMNLTDLLTIIALSSMIHPEPITIGPAIAKIVALG
jgi:hypothetical protein